MKKIIALSGASLALFVAGLIFFANSSANNVSANEAEQKLDDKRTSCSYFAENGTCGCAANGGVCNCAQKGAGTCMGDTGKKQEQRKSTCGCQNNQ